MSKISMKDRLICKEAVALGSCFCINIQNVDAGFLQMHVVGTAAASAFEARISARMG